MRCPGWCGSFRQWSRGEPQGLNGIDRGVRAVSFFDGAPDPGPGRRLQLFGRMLESHGGVVEVRGLWFHEFTVRVLSTICNQENCTMQIWHSGGYARFQRSMVSAGFGSESAATSPLAPLHAVERGTKSRFDGSG